MSSPAYSSVGRSRLLLRLGILRGLAKAVPWVRVRSVRGWGGPACPRPAPRPARTDRDGRSVAGAASKGMEHGTAHASVLVYM